MSGLSNLRSLSGGTPTPAPAPPAGGPTPAASAPPAAQAAPGDRFVPSTKLDASIEELTTLLMSGEISSVYELFFGAAPTAEPARARDNYFLSHGGWKIKLPNPAPTVPMVEMPLPDNEPVGTVRGDGPPAGHVPMGKWTRVQGGWESVSKGKPSAKGRKFATSSVLTARLGDDGSLALKLKVNRPDGSVVQYDLDGAAYLENPGKWPEMKGVEALRAPDPALAAKTAPEPEAAKPEIREDGDWIVIDRVRIPRNG